MTHDIRHALRSLRRAPGFTAVAALTLALGIGATTAIFSIADAVLFRPLVVPEAERVLALWETNRARGAERLLVAPANFLDWRERAQVFDGVAAIEPYGFDYLGGVEPQSLVGARVTEDFFRVVRVAPLLGRTLLPEDYRSGARVVVIGYDAWRGRFGADPGIVGRTLVLDGEPYTVVGVLPRGFTLSGERTEIWAPVEVSGEGQRAREAQVLNVIARLRTGITFGHAVAELGRIAAELAREYPRTNANLGIAAVPLPEQVVGEARPALLLLLGAVGLLLLIACSNVANLFLARGLVRRGEIATRRALGASTGRLLRHALVESLVLALLGGGLGVLAAPAIVDAALALAPENVPRLELAAVDGRVLAFAVVVMVAASLFFGVLPTLRLGRIDPARALGDGGRSGTSAPAPRRAARGLVVAQVAVALVLLAGAGLLVRSFVGLLRVDPGFAAEDRLAVQLFVYDRPPEQRRLFFEESIERIRSLPGVRSAAAASAFPFAESDIAIDVTVEIEGAPAPPGMARNAYVNIVTPDFFRTLGVPLRAGRALTAEDREDSRAVAVINERMARMYFPGEDPIGKRIRLEFGRDGTREIVGVVGDMLHTGLAADARPEVFLPMAQYPFGAMTLVVHADGPAGPLLAAMKREIWSVAPTLGIHDAAAVDALVARTLRPERFVLALLGAFAAIALSLAAVGIYGMLSFWTRARAREIGIRIALGAQRGEVLRLVVGEGAVLAAIGVGIGLVGALGLGRFLDGLLHGVRPNDPVVIATVVVVLIAVALAASWLPARAAARIEPMTALRVE